MERQQSSFSKPRVETFSDGVFAIIITILVLEIRVPHIANHNSVNELLLALVALFPKFISWIVSFFMIAVVWVNHHQLFDSITHITHRVFWANAYLLLWCAFVPFPTALLGDYINNPAACFVFGFVLSLMGFGFLLLRYVILKEDLLIKTVSRVRFKQDSWRTLFFGCLSYLIGAFCAWLNPVVSFCLYTFIPIYFIVFNVRATGHKLNNSKE